MQKLFDQVEIRRGMKTNSNHQMEPEDDDLRIALYKTKLEGLSLLAAKGPPRRMPTNRPESELESESEAAKEAREAEMVVYQEEVKGWEMFLDGCSELLTKRLPMTRGEMLDEWDSSSRKFKPKDDIRMWEYSDAHIHILRRVNFPIMDLKVSHVSHARGNNVF